MVANVDAVWADMPVLQVYEVVVVVLVEAHTNTFLVASQIFAVSNPCSLYYSL